MDQEVIFAQPMGNGADNVIMNTPPTFRPLGPSFPGALYIEDYPDSVRFSRNDCEEPNNLSIRTTEILLDSTAKVFTKLKTQIYDTLEFLDENNFPDAILEATDQLKKLKQDFYKIRLSHEEGNQQSNATLRDLRSQLHQIERDIISIQSEVMPPNLLR